jgi:hypothetical protein
MNQSKNQMSSKQEQSKTASKMRIRAFPVNLIIFIIIIYLEIFNFLVIL